MDPNPIRCYVTKVEYTDTRLSIEGFGSYPEYYEPPFLFTAVVTKMSWEDFQQRLGNADEVTRWRAYSVVSKDDVYEIDVGFTYDTDRVHELEEGPWVELVEYALLESPKLGFGLPLIVYTHLIGQLTAKTSPTQ
jgi:hypothetical protein